MGLSNISPIATFPNRILFLGHYTWKCTLMYLNVLFGYLWIVHELSPLPMASYMIHEQFLKWTSNTLLQNCVNIFFSLAFTRFFSFSLHFLSNPEVSRVHFDPEYCACDWLLNDKFIVNRILQHFLQWGARVLTFFWSLFWRGSEEQKALKCVPLNLNFLWTSLF